MQESIGQNNFHTWKSDEVTKEVFKRLREAREEINLTLTNAEILLGADSHQVIPRLVGQREGIDLILEIQFENLQEIQHEGEETLRSSSDHQT